MKGEQQVETNLRELSLNDFGGSDSDVRPTLRLILRVVTAVNSSEEELSWVVVEKRVSFEADSWREKCSILTLMSQSSGVRSTPTFTVIGERKKKDDQIKKREGKKSTDENAESVQELVAKEKVCERCPYSCRQPPSRKTKYSRLDLQWKGPCRFLEVERRRKQKKISFSSFLNFLRAKTRELTFKELPSTHIVTNHRQLNTQRVFTVTAVPELISSVLDNSAQSITTFSSRCTISNGDDQDRFTKLVRSSRTQEKRLKNFLIQSLQKREIP